MKIKHNKGYSCLNLLKKYNKYRIHQIVEKTEVSYEDRFLGDVIFEGDDETTKAKYEEFKEELTERLDRLYEELPNLYPKREIDTNETYFENLKILNPVAYENLSYIKELFGDKFLAFDFDKMSLAGIYVTT